MRVMEQTLLPFAPREPLVADPHVLVRNERGPLVVLRSVLNVAIDHAQADRRQGDEEREVLPQFVTTFVASGDGGGAANDGAGGRGQVSPGGCCQNRCHFLRVLRFSLVSEEIREEILRNLSVEDEPTAANW